MLLWISASWTITSSRPSRCPIRVTFVEWPPTRATLSSALCSRANARSRSRWTGRSPETGRLAETEVPQRSIAAFAASAISRMAVQPEVVVGRKIYVAFAVDDRLGAGDAVMHAEKRIGDAEKFGCFADHADFLGAFELRYAEPAAIADRAQAAAIGASRRGSLRGGAPTPFPGGAPWPAATDRTGCALAPSGYSAAAFGSARSCAPSSRPPLPLAWVRGAPPRPPPRRQAPRLRARRRAARRSRQRSSPRPATPAADRSAASLRAPAAARPPSANPSPSATAGAPDQHCPPAISGCAPPLPQRWSSSKFSAASGSRLRSRSASASSPADKSRLDIGSRKTVEWRIPAESAVRRSNSPPRNRQPATRSPASPAAPPRLAPLAIGLAPSRRASASRASARCAK